MDLNNIEENDGLSTIPDRHFKPKIRKGIIVVVGYNTHVFGNLKGSIIKTLAQPGEGSDKAFKITGKRICLSKKYILCEVATPVKVKRTTITCNNKPALYHHTDGLKIANVHERQAYTKGIRHVNDIKEKVTQENTDVDFEEII